VIHVVQQSSGRLREVYESIEESEEENQAAAAFLREHADKDVFAVLDDKALQRELATMPFYELQGYSLGRAYASPISGDTVFSVLIPHECEKGVGPNLKPWSDPSRSYKDSYQCSER
jgi:hypothetical protein